MNKEHESIGADAELDSPKHRRFFQRFPSFEGIDRFLTMLFLCGYPKPICKATDGTNIRKLIDDVSDMKLDEQSEDTLEELMNIVSESQNQAIHHTEYEDLKASRILAPVAFVASLGSFLMFRIVDMAESGFVKISAVAFTFLFIFLVIVGTLIILWGIVPRFNLPKKSPPTIDSTFFGQIANATPSEWRSRWEASDMAQIRKTEIRNRIIGSYLISGKVVIKVAMIRRGILFLSGSLVVLLIGAIFFLVLQLSASTPGNVQKGKDMLIAIDADNTLWDTNAVFKSAQEGLIKHFCDAMNLRTPDEALQKLRIHDQKIASGHPDGFKYPVSLLLEQLRIDWGGGRMIEGWESKRELIASSYQQALEVPAVPFKGLRKTLEALRSRGKLLLVTEGRESCIRTELVRLGIEDCFERIEFIQKSPRMFLELLRYSNDDYAIMIGDQLKSDIEFAASAGWRTIWIPGDFRPYWEETTVGVDRPDIVVDSLDAVPGAVDRIMKVIAAGGKRETTR
ncbi:MAG: HAD family hydrolase [Verrucomicrobiota bacterium]